jgi:hypothetical protein
VSTLVINSHRRCEVNRLHGQSCCVHLIFLELRRLLAQLLLASLRAALPGRSRGLRRRQPAHGCQISSAAQNRWKPENVGEDTVYSLCGSCGHYIDIPALARWRGDGSHLPAPCLGGRALCRRQRLVLQAQPLLQHAKLLPLLRLPALGLAPAPAPRAPPSIS